MSFSKEKREQIMFRLAKGLKYHPTWSVASIGAQLGISKQTTYRYIHNMKEQGILYQSTVDGRYRLKALSIQRHKIRNESVEEDRIYTQFVAPKVQNLSKSCRDKFQYAVEEMINNAKDHSQGTYIGLIIKEDYVSVRVIVLDNGIGVFEKIRGAFQLNSINDAILELDKGKCTTDSEHHSGEGIFFSSKMFDLFFIQANNLTYVARNEYDHSFLLEDIKGNHDVGTYVSMELAKDNKETTQDVFSRFNDEESFDFNKTIVSVVHLIDRRNTTDMTLMSRSQARRLLSRFDKFKAVCLDFNEIEAIGQGFADEIFRIYVNAHPDIEINYMNANRSVERMILHAKNTKV